MTYPCKCGAQAGSDGRKYHKSRQAMKRRYRCKCGAVIHTIEYLDAPGFRGRPRKSLRRAA